MQGDLKGLVKDSLKKGVKAGLSDWLEGRKEWWQETKESGMTGDNAIFHESIDWFNSEKAQVKSDWENVDAEAEKIDSTWARLKYQIKNKSKIAVTVGSRILTGEVAFKMIDEVTGNPVSYIGKATGADIKKKLKLDELQENASILQKEMEQYNQLLKDF